MPVLMGSEIAFQAMDASVEVMVANLRSEQADRFDLGMRQAAALARLLQDTPAVAGGSAEGRYLVETALAGIGRALEASIERRSDPARHDALNKAATALVQALVGSGSAQPRTPSEALQRLVVGSVGCNDVDWNCVRVKGVLSLLGTPETTRAHSTRDSTSLTDLAMMALHAPALGHLSGSPNPLLQAAYTLAPALPRGSCPRSWTVHLLLRPQSLTELLESVLRTLCAQGLTQHSPSSLRDALASHPDWAAGLSATAAHPALLLTARATLRSWLASSGSITAWVLHWELFRLAISINGAVPPLLYPGPLCSAAEGVHTAIQSTLKGDIAGPDVSAALAEVQRALTVAGGVRLHEEAWALMLDAPALAAAALDQLSWATLLEGGEEGGDGDAMEADGGGGLCTVEGAEWLAALAWPFAGQAGQRQELATALMEGRAATPAGQAGVAALACWRTAWPLEDLKEN